MTEERKITDESGFSLAWALVLIFLIAFAIAAGMSLIKIWVALVAFVVVAILIAFISTLPDLIRYVKISRM